MITRATASYLFNTNAPSLAILVHSVTAVSLHYIWLNPLRKLSFGHTINLMVTEGVLLGDMKWSLRRARPRRILLYSYLVFWSVFSMSTPYLKGGTMKAFPGYQRTSRMFMSPSLVYDSLVVAPVIEFNTWKSIWQNTTEIKSSHNSPQYPDQQVACLIE